MPLSFLRTAAWKYCCENRRHSSQSGGSSTQFRSNLLQLADLMALHSCRRLLIDARAVLYLELADQHWVMRHLVPLLSPTPLELQACVVSQVSLELMDTDRMFANLSNQANLEGKMIASRFFLDASHAREWLFQGFQPPTLE